MRIEQIKYMVSLAETLSFTDSAKLLYIAQSTLSEAISKLEEEIGTQLLFRSNKGVELTPIGNVFVEEGKKVLIAMDNLTYIVQEKINHNIEMEKETLSIGSFPLTNSIHLPKIISLFRSNFPKVQLISHEMNFMQILTSLKEKEIDLALVNIINFNDSLDVFEKKLEEYEVFYNKIHFEKIEVLLSRFHPLVENKEISMHDFVKYPIIIFSNFLSKNNNLHSLLQSYVHTEEDLNIALNTNNMNVYKDYIINQQGISLAPLCLTIEILNSCNSYKEKPIKIRSLSENITHHYYLLYDNTKKLSYTEKKFVEITKKYLEK